MSMRFKLILIIFSGENSNFKKRLLIQNAKYYVHLFERYKIK